MRIILITVGILFILAIIAAVILLVVTKKPAAKPTNNQSYVTSENTALNALKEKSTTLTSASLAAINTTDLFYSVFRNAAEQSTVVTTKNFYETTSLNSAPLSSSESNVDGLTQAGYNYANGQFSFQDYDNSIIDYCINGTDYDYSTDAPSVGWQQSPTGNGDCQVANTDTTINDGLNTGGLTTAQAQKYVDELRNMQNLITVTDANLVSVQGKNYIRFDVTVNTNTSCSETYSAMGCFNQAYNTLGLPSSWPFDNASSIASGASFAYYVDPTTQLPVYTQIAYTPVSGSSNNWTNQQIEYSFGTLPTFSIANSTNVIPITITWPITTLQSIQ